jgi:hypothetical protein
MKACPASSLPGGTLGRAMLIHAALFGFAWARAGSKTVLWRFEFYSVDGRGIRRGSETINPGAPPIPLNMAAQQARGMMTAITFTFGRANHCRLTSEDGTIVKELVSYAQKR